jgi:hypothetical protein
MPFEEYWIGKDVDLDTLWSDFQQGGGYIEKVTQAEVHLLRLTFGGHPPYLPLFDHEVIYKTVKATFHDVKEACLTPGDYDEAAPIFLYRVDRGSGIYEFFAELKPLIPYVAMLGTVVMGYLGFLIKEQDLLEKKIAFLQTKFPRAPNIYVKQYIGAHTPWRRRAIVQQLIEKGYLERIEVSKRSVTGKAHPETEEMVDVVKTLESNGD